MGKNNRPKAIETPDVVAQEIETPDVVAQEIETPDVVEVPVIVYPNVVVYDTEDGNALKVVSAREARHPRYKPV